MGLDTPQTQWIEEHCEGCIEDGWGDERSWIPHRDCPVHGEHPEPFWTEFNELFPPTPNMDAVARVAARIRS